MQATGASDASVTPNAATAAIAPPAAAAAAPSFKYDGQLFSSTATPFIRTSRYYASDSHLIKWFAQLHVTYRQMYNTTANFPLSTEVISKAWLTSFLATHPLEKMTEQSTALVPILEITRFPLETHKNFLMLYQILESSSVLKDFLSLLLGTGTIKRTSFWNKGELETKLFKFKEALINSHKPNFDRPEDLSAFNKDLTKFKNTVAKQLFNFNLKCATFLAQRKFLRIWYSQTENHQFILEYPVTFYHSFHATLSDELLASARAAKKKTGAKIGKPKRSSKPTPPPKKMSISCSTGAAAAAIPQSRQIPIFKKANT